MWCRTRWLLSSTVLGLLLIGVARTTAQSADQGTFSVAAGDVEQTAIVLWAHSDVIGKVSFEIATEAAFGTLVGTQTAEIIDPMLPVKVEVNGLAPHTRYYYRVTDAAGEQRVGRFRTTAVLGERVGLR